MENIRVSPDLTRCEIWHKDFNLKAKHNLDDLPRENGVFGIFAMVDEDPVNCRYVGDTDDLQRAVADMFLSKNTGMDRFMQGPWIKVLLYQLTPAVPQHERQRIVEAWKNKYNPQIDEHGEYPGYYE